MPEENNKQNQLDRDAFEREIGTDLDEETPDKPKGLPLHTKILIGLAVGVIAGVGVNQAWGGDDSRVVWVVDNFTQPVGQLFLRLLLMIVVPLVFSSLVVGVAGIGDIRKLGRVGLKSFAYCLVISGISVVIGITLANRINPGKRIDPATSAALQERYASDATKTVEAAMQASGATPKPLMAVVETIVPKNPFFGVSGREDPNMLHLMFFALVVGIAITLLPVTVTAPLLRVLEGL
jgi:DAACS family dicarboxylate/amino acid:cation (Na+ or H+) symporter